MLLRTLWPTKLLAWPHVSIVNSLLHCIRSVLEQIQEIRHDTVSRLAWLQSRDKTITENKTNKIF